jgi:hypothetical protein
MQHLGRATRGLRLGASVIVASAGTLGLISSQAGATTDPFDQPSSLAIIGSHLFVANQGNGTVSELDASTGSPIATLPAATVNVAGPRSIVADGTKLFIAGSTGAVSELSSNGTFLGQESFPGCKGGTAGLAVESSSTVVELCENGRLAELSTSSPPTLISSVKLSVTGLTLSSATAIAIEGATAYVTFTTPENASDGIAAVSLATGTVLHEVNEMTEPADAFAAPAGVAVAGKELWLTNAGTNSIGPSVEELNRSDLSFVVSDDNTGHQGTSGAILASHTPGEEDTDVYVATIAVTTAPMVTYYDYNPTNPTNPPYNPAFNFKWMMCNTNTSGTTTNPNRLPYKFNHPSAFAVYDSSILWVANEGTDGNSWPPEHVEAMNATTGAFLFNAQ